MASPNPSHTAKEPHPPSFTLDYGDIPARFLKDLEFDHGLTFFAAARDRFMLQSTHALAATPAAEQACFTVHKHIQGKIAGDCDRIDVPCGLAPHPSAVSMPVRRHTSPSLVDIYNKLGQRIPIFLAVPPTTRAALELQRFFLPAYL